MMKAFLKYLLILCILLLCGSNYLAARECQKSAFITSNQTIDAGATASFKCIQRLTSSSHASLVAKDKAEKPFFAIDEMEEDELALFKKFLESSQYIAAVFYAFICGYLFLYLIKSICSNTHFSQRSSYRRHILLQVFRI